MSNLNEETGRLDRRAFVRSGSLYLFGAHVGLASCSTLLAEDAKRLVRLGLVTDMHYADKPPAGTRYYRESLTKLQEAAEQFKKDRTELVVELGDIVDAAESVDVEKTYLKRVNKAFLELPGEKHYVLGNHCVYTLTKDEFLDCVGRKKSYYSFDAKGVHFVILDACFRSDGQPYGRQNFKWTDPNLNAAQVDWLRADLKEASGPTVVFVHQRLDVSNQYGVKNAADVRKVLEDSGKVLAVFQGHSHKNDYREIAGIHYCTLVAVVEGSGAENNAYSIMDVLEGGSIRVTGFRKQKNYQWS